MISSTRSNASGGRSFNELSVFLGMNFSLFSLEKYAIIIVQRVSEVFLDLS